MSALLNTYEHRLDAVLQFAEGRTGEGPSWLRELRRRSLAAFREQGLPTPRQEEWKYTPLRAVAETAWASAEPGPATFDFPLPFSVEGSIRIVLVNGQFDRNLSEIPTDSALQIHSLFSALSDALELVEQQIGSLVATSDFPFAALNSCLFHDGAVIHIRGEVERVVELIHVSFGSGQVLAPRVLIVAEPNSKARITETYVSAPDAGNLVIPVTEARIAEGAEIEHVRVQDEATTSHHVGLWEARQQADSTYLAYNVAYGGSLGRLDQNIFIAGERCTTRLDGVAVARGAQLLDNHTKLDHAVPNCNSFEVYKQIV
ncbi:MAG: SufD family Fe-S cluster assembly protein, partial [Fimbriimonadaceae bacterium]|nr:SufD family Fe-S cluster assembly protein [Fimbriimonadaceae bacterium]